MFAEKTYREKRSMFKKFYKYIDPNLPVTELKSSMVMDYLLRQKEQRSGYAANKDRKNLIAAWNWGMMYMNPVLPPINPCKVRKLPEVRSPRYIPSAEDFWKVYNVAEGQDRVMLLTFLHTAGRRGEIFRLKKSDLDFEQNRVRLWTRKRAGGNMESNWLPMTMELKEALLWWLQSRPIKDSPYVFLCLDKYNFCSEQYGQRFKYRQNLMPRLCEKAGVKKFGFHSIRHLSSTILFAKGHSLGVIQAILRHENPLTTTKYLKSLGIENVREALQDLSIPKSKIVKFEPKIIDGSETNGIQGCRH
jgi:integrase